MKSVIFGVLVAAGLAGTAASAQAQYPSCYGGGYRPAPYPTYYGSAYYGSPYGGHYHSNSGYGSPYRSNYGYYNSPYYAQPAPYYYGPQNSIGIYGPRGGIRIGF